MQGCFEFCFDVRCAQMSDDAMKAKIVLRMKLSTANGKGVTNWL